MIQYRRATTRETGHDNMAKQPDLPGIPPGTLKLELIEKERIKTALDGRIDALRRLRAKQTPMTAPWGALDDEITAVINLKGKFL